MIPSIPSERMKTTLALVCPPLLLVSAAALSLLITSPSSGAGTAKKGASNVVTSLPDINTGRVPMTKDDIEVLRSSWDNALSWWWLQNRPIPWDAHCAGTSRDSYRQGWYPLSCFMIPVRRIQATNISGRLSLGETQVFGMSDVTRNKDEVTSNVTVLDCRKGHDCKPTVLHHLTMAVQDWDVLKSLIGVVRGNIPDNTRY